ncbi:hypothetical protein [Parvibaculum sp.]|jgi:hypothetical protein|uniref:hypothetical protein n=1 Tax=Parvibaculum sp. TaxID=2024848 RepID=UPI001B111CEE|nr:hypothetical protein [Parvibaculum sp.]MBO6678651.1 hypothetical protein [Parvibaculum sp.]MBO6684261.1 hypothetical protein [Parvibaculum sp.]MBO6906384.1 hypothetical protein [Parvibaculum sp.]
MDFLLSGLFSGAFSEWIEAVLAIVGAASAVAAATPTRKDDDVVGKISRIIDIVALNIGHAKRQ